MRYKTGIFLAGKISLFADCGTSFFGALSTAKNYRLRVIYWQMDDLALNFMEPSVLLKELPSTGEGNQFKMMENTSKSF